MKSIIFVILLFGLSGCLDSKPDAEAKTASATKPAKPSKPVGPGVPAETIILKTESKKFSTLEMNAVEENQNICRKVSGLPANFQIDQNLISFAQKNPVHSWNRWVEVNGNQYWIQITDVFGLQSQTVPYGEKPKDLDESQPLCWLPSAVKIHSMGLSISFPQALQKQGEARAITPDSAASILRAGVEWRPWKQVDPVLDMDTLRFNWFLQSQKTAHLESIVEQELGFLPEVSEVSVIDSKPTLLQVSSDDFESDNSIWIFEKKGLFAPNLSEADPVDPWSPGEDFVGASLLRGVYMHGFEPLTLAPYRCEEVNSCVNLFARSVRDVMARSLSLGNLWIRFVSHSQTLDQNIVSKVKVDMKEGKILSVESRIQTSQDRIPEVQ